MTDAQIVDAHHHIWRMQRTPWLAGPPAPRIFGPYDAIRRDYLIEEYAADATPHGVVTSVHVQANVAVGEEVEEARWASSTGLVSGYLVEHDGFRLLIDAGYATLPRLLDRVTADQVDAVFISHGHPDHCADLSPLLRARAAR